MTEPFDQHDAAIRRIAAKLRKGTHMHKSLTDATTLLERALVEWQADCPGAGWEHHNSQALVSLAIQESMRELLRLAAVGKAYEDGDTAELKHVADRIYTSNPEYEQVMATYQAAAKSARDVIK